MSIWWTLVQKLQCKIFPRKTIVDNFKPLCYCNFMYKIVKLPQVDFSWNLKTFIWGLFRALSAWKPWNEIFFFFKKTPALSLFKFDDIVTSCKKIQKKILWPIPEQNSGQTDRKSKCKNGRRVFHSTFTSYVQVISNVLRDLVTIVQFKKREK